MIEDTQVEDDVKFAHCLRGQIDGVDLTGVYFKTECGPGNIKCLTTMNIGMRPAI